MNVVNLYGIGHYARDELVVHIHRKASVAITGDKAKTNSQLGFRSESRRNQRSA